MQHASFHTYECLLARTDGTEFIFSSVYYTGLRGVLSVSTHFAFVDMETLLAHLFILLCTTSPSLSHVLCHILFPH